MLPPTTTPPPPQHHRHTRSTDVCRGCCRVLQQQWGAVRSSDRRCRTLRAAARGSSWPEPFDDTTKRALREAAEVLSEAQELARQQTLSDLMSSWAADTAAAGTAAADAAGASNPEQALPSTSPLPDPQQEKAAAAAAAAGQQASSPAALEAFWCEQGLKVSEAQQLMREVQSDPQLAATCSNTQVLSDKLASLGRVLPGVAVAALVARVPQLLNVPSSTAVAVLVHLVNALPGCDVVDMVCRQPRLLLLEVEGLPQQLQTVLGKLKELHPSHLDNVVAGIVEENPELLLRMPYYLDATLLDDLPVEIQNMMVLGDHGLGYLYRYWNNRLTQPRRSEGDSGKDGDGGSEGSGL